MPDFCPVCGGREGQHFDVRGTPCPHETPMTLEAPEDRTQAGALVMSPRQVAERMRRVATALRTREPGPFIEDWASELEALADELDQAGEPRSNLYLEEEQEE
jgi:hypothetical protein